MPLDDRQRDDLARLPALITPLMPLAGLANPAIGTITFAYGLLMRLVGIGARIREVLQEEQKALLSEVKAQGLFRVPVLAVTEPLEIRAFVDMGARRYPRALKQLEHDVVALDQPLHSEHRSAAERLAIAMHIIPRVYDRYEHTGRIALAEDPLLTDVHLHLLNPGEPAIYRALVENLHLERMSVFASETSSLGLVRERLPMYVLLNLKGRQGALEQARAEALAAFNATVRDLYWDAVFGRDGEPGVIEETTDFIVTRSLARIDEELEALAEERQGLDPAAGDAQARLDAIEERRAQLEDLRTRIAEARS